MEEKGEVGFSVRGLGQRAGCDPMTVLYHFGSKESLYRAMASRMEEELPDADVALDWRDRLRHLATEYRGLALRYPNSFWLLQKFVHSGVADLKQTEMVHQALGQAGVPQPQIPEVCIGWYACVIGLSMGETAGLVRAFTAEEAAEIEALSPEAFPGLHAALPGYLSLSPSSVFTRTVDILLDGVGRSPKSG